MSVNHELITQVIDSKNLNERDSKLVRNCSVELCHLCDTQKRLTKLSDLFSNLTDAILIFDLDSNLVDANRLGYSIYNDFEYFKYKDVNYHLIDLPVVKSLSTKDLLDERIATVTAISRKEEPKIFNISASTIYTEMSFPAGLCVVINDATKLQEQALQLEDMMASLTHDLKTPLIAAEINLKNFMQGYYGDVSEEQKKLLKMMLDSNAGALKLVQNLLTIFKYETQSYRILPKAITLETLFQKSLALLNALIEEKSIIIKFADFDLSQTVVCDAFEVERVITNILSNAIKFSPDNSVIEINVLKGQESILFSIKDHGIGIPENKLINLFSRFWQSKQHKPNTTGTGLGLYLARKIVEAHGGKIWATSQEGIGTTVSFILPIMIETKFDTHD